MTIMFRLIGRAVTGLAVVAVVAGWAAWTWFTGRPWRRHYRGRRYVTRPVRAAGNVVVTAVAVGLTLAPLVTAAVLAALGAALVSAALVTRHRRHRSVMVLVGEPIPARPRPRYTPPRWRPETRPVAELERAA